MVECRGRTAAPRLQADATDHVARLGFGKIGAVNVDLALFHLDEIRLDEAVVKIFEEGHHAPLEFGVRKALLSPFNRLQEGRG
jgi:hypothetical protein